MLKALERIGVIAGGDMTTEASLMKLSYLIAKYPGSPDDIKQVHYGVYDYYDVCLCICVYVCEGVVHVCFCTCSIHNLIALLPRTITLYYVFV